MAASTCHFGEDSLIFMYECPSCSAAARCSEDLGLEIPRRPGTVRPLPPAHGAYQSIALSSSTLVRGMSERPTLEEQAVKIVNVLERRPYDVIHFLWTVMKDAPSDERPPSNLCAWSTPKSCAASHG